MNKKHLIPLLLLIGVFGFTQIQSNVFAKGGGSADDGNTECSADTYDCEDWSKCEEGTQTRTCTLSFDCENTNDKKPIESQSCEMPKSEEDEQPKETVEEEDESSMTEDIEEEEVEIPNCESIDYECSKWGICEEDGRQRRQCQLSKQCANEPTSPEQERVCPGIQCGHLDTIKERIECRLKLSKREAKKEKKILYSPEYCRIEEGAQEKAECINLYWALERCWAMPAGEKRQKCGWEEAGMEDFSKKKIECASLDVQTEQPMCYEELKEMVENWILFEMYELEFLAESLLEEGRVEFEDVVELDLFVESQKAKIDKDNRIKSWKKIIKETQEEWKLFVNQKVK